MSGQDETPAERGNPTGQASRAAIPEQPSVPEQPSAPARPSVPGQPAVGEQPTVGELAGAPIDQAPVYDQASVPDQAIGSDQASARDRERQETQPLGAVPEHDGAMADDDARSLGQLVASASRDLSALVRGEIALAKAELSESARAATKGAGLFGAAGFLAYVAFLMLSIAAGYGLVAAGFHPAVAFVIVGVVYLLVAGIIAFVGLRSVRKAKGPERTLHSIEEAKGMVGRGNAGGNTGGDRSE
ncbi:phage holin family protein [Actinopolymorpha sp. B17G11]|uniref:phage holin family protein n=1 Tax=Actinopolymorpha sp. B17G11 TaxID=3160861 RepID=UPI0032E51D7A